MTASIALVGCGGWGSNHLRVLAELGVLRAVCDADERRLAVVAERYPNVRTTTSTRSIWDAADIEAAVIATPAITHAVLAREALLAGKDVLVEKPMALDVTEAAELTALASAEGRIFAVGHVLEYHPAVRRLRDLVTAGELGRLRYLYATRLNFGKIRTEENVLWSFAPHDIAIILRLLGEDPVSVSCQRNSYLSAGVADATVTHLTFDKGVQAHIYVSWIHPFKEHRFVVVGEKKMAVFDDTAPWPEKLVLYEHSVDWVGGQVPVAQKAAGQAVALDVVEPLLAQAEAFIDAVRTRRAPIADARSGAAVLNVLYAAQRSLEYGGVPQTPGVSDAFVHPTAIVDPGAVIGDGTKVWHFVHVMGGAHIGRGCVLGQNVFVAAGVHIGDGVRLQNNVSVFEGVTLSDRVFCGPSVTFTNVMRPRSEINQRSSFLPTVVHEGASIGANATIVCGTTIGRYAFVGAGAVVTSDVADHALVVGSPARVVGWVCRCGERLSGEGPTGCAACGRSYVLDGHSVRDV